MPYKVTKKFMRGTESLVSSFRNIDAAKQCIQEKLAEDAVMKINATYCLYEGVDLISQFDQSHRVEESSDANESASPAQRGSGQSYAPNPFNMTLRPTGMPKSQAGTDQDKSEKEK